MKVLTKIGSAATAAALMASVLVAGTTTANAAPCAANLKIYFQGALTGSYAETGINEYNGVKLAIKNYMAKSPTTKIDADAIDTEASGAKSPALAQKVVDDPCGLAVVGGMYSGETLAAAPILQAGKVPTISPSATNPQLTNKSPYFHRVVANDLVQGPALAGIAKRLKTKVFVVDDATPYGAGLAKIFKSDAAKIIVGSDSVTEGTTNFSSVVTKVKSSKATAVFYGGYYPEAAIFIKALRDNPSTKNIKFIAGDGVLDGEYIKLAKKNAEGSYLTAPGLDMKAAAPTLYKQYKAEYNKEPGLYTLEAYNATYFVLEGIKAGKTERDALNTWIGGATVKGVGMTMSFLATGDSAATIMNEYTIKNGKMVWVRKL